MQVQEGEELQKVQIEQKEEEEKEILEQFHKKRCQKP